MDASCDFHPRCFMHIQKAAGTSVRESLKTALPDANFALKSFDASSFCGGFDDFDSLSEDLRAEVAADYDEVDAMAEADVIFGHFCLASLTRVAPPASVATVLREPRARVLSQYSYWRLLTPELRRAWRPYRAPESAERPIKEFLADPSLAVVTDNHICRMLLHEDGYFRASEFTPRSDVPTIAAAAIERLQTFGSVSVLELGSMWSDLSRFFGVSLEPLRVNITGVEIRPTHRPLRLRVTPEVLALLEERTRADAAVYRHVLQRQDLASEEIEGFCDALVVAEFMHLADACGDSAVARNVLQHQLREREGQLRKREGQLREREGQLRERDDQLRECRDTVLALRASLKEREREVIKYDQWLNRVLASRSWRMTAPLRAAQRALGSRPRARD